jgi:phage gpG-like protein
MARVTTYQRINQQAIKALLTSPARGTIQDLLKRGLRVESAAKRNLSGVGGSGPKRVDTGRLRASITTAVVSRSGVPAVVVGTNVVYARWVHDGTGLYGPRRRMIRPVGHRFLRFKPKGSRGYVYAKQVKGMKPNPFLAKALSAAKK